MDGRGGGCCIARYTAGDGGGGAYASSKVDRIMLRYRPIAPKPTATTSSNEGSSPKSEEDPSKYGRGKKRLSKESPKRCSRKRKLLSSEEKSKVTLPLLPETPIRKDDGKNYQTTTPSLLSFSRSPIEKIVVLDPVQAAMTVRSCVTVECVTDTWIDGDGMGSTDREKQVQLAKDTCPGFVTDGVGRVTWTNEAYRKMVNGEVGGVMVWVVMKERLLITYPAFSCRVKVQYTCGKERSSVLTLPCDVWRMEGGGFAWRLDVKAALCL